jgi:uncharacterized protein (TIGR02001 family)
MKNVFGKMIATALVGLALTAPIAAKAAEGEASASVGVYSNYVWRGQTLSDEAVIQPTVGLSYGGFGINLWSNLDLDTNQLNETDLTLNFANSVDKLSYDVGYIYYGLDGLEDTQEIYLSLAYDIMFSPSATFYYDFDEGEGGFLVLAAGYSIPVMEKYSIDFGADVTVNFENAILGLDEDGEEFTGFYNADLSVGSSIPLMDAVTLDLLLAYSLALGDDAEAAIPGASVDGEDDVFSGGAALSVAF